MTLASIESDAKTILRIREDRTLSVYHKRAALAPHLSRYLEELIVNTHANPSYSTYDKHVLNGIGGCVSLKFLAKTSHLLLGRAPTIAEDAVSKATLRLLTNRWANTLTFGKTKPIFSKILMPRLMLDVEYALIDELLARLPPSSKHISHLPDERRTQLHAQQLALISTISAVSSHNSKHLKSANLSLIHIPVKELQTKIDEQIRRECANALNNDLDPKILSPTLQLFGCVKSL